MKNGCTLALLACLAGPAAAQERIPQDEAIKIARFLTDHAAKETGLAFKTEVDVEQPFGLKAGEAGGMILPDKKLAADAIARPGKQVVPIGHLWFKKVAPVVGDKVIANDKLRLVTVNHEGQDIVLTLQLVGVRAGKDGPELVIYGKDKEPLLTTPLKKMDGKNEQPVELEAKKTGDKQANLTINILGKYQATFPVGEQE